MKICWFGIYNKDYPRNYIFLEGLAELGVEVVHCQVDPTEPKWFSKLSQQFRAIEDEIDVVYVGFPAQVSVLVAKYLTRKPVVMDAMTSAYEGVVHVRKQRRPWHPQALKLWLLDWLAALAADAVVTDTEQHKLFWSSWPLVRKQKIHAVPIGCSTQHFYPLAATAPASSKKLLVQYHGSYIKVQGLDVIIDAIELLKDDPEVVFRFIGAGEELPYVERRLKECCKEKVTFIGRTPFTELNRYLNEADIIFGLFGEQKRADRAVPNKLYEGVAVRRAVINKDAPAVREAFNEGDVMLVERNGRAIADAIIKLKDPVLRERYAQDGYKTFLEKFTQTQVAKRLLAVLQMQRRS